MQVCLTIYYLLLPLANRGLKKLWKYVQIHYSLKNEILKKSFIGNMDFQEELAAAVVVYILEQKKKTEKTENLGKTLVQAKSWNWVLPFRLPFCPCWRLILCPTDLYSLQIQIKHSFSSCFWFMVAILPFLYQLYEKEIPQGRFFYFEFSILNTFIQKIYDSPIRRQYILIEPL